MSNLIGISDEHTAGKQFPVGEQIDDVKLTKVEYKDGEYGPSLIFHLGKGGATLMDFRTVPTEQMKPWSNSTLEETIAGTANELNRAMREYLEAGLIYDKVLSRAQAEIPAESDAIQAVQAYEKIINETLEDAKPFRIKTLKRVHKGNVYAKAPKYPPFAEPMSKVPSELEYTPKEIEMMAKSSKKGVEEVEADATEVDFDAEY